MTGAEIAGLLASMVFASLWIGECIMSRMWRRNSRGWRDVAESHARAAERWEQMAMEYADIYAINKDESDAEDA